MYVQLSLYPINVAFNLRKQVIWGYQLVIVVYISVILDLLLVWTFDCRRCK
jgi:hypothetical protein